LFFLLFATILLCWHLIISTITSANFPSCLQSTMAR
jgi:hypothetical protein